MLKNVSNQSLFLFSQNHDGQLTMEEFREGSKCDPWIVQALAIDLPGAEITGDVKPQPT